MNVGKYTFRPMDPIQIDIGFFGKKKKYHQVCQWIVREGQGLGPKPEIQGIDAGPNYNIIFHQTRCFPEISDFPY